LPGVEEELPGLVARRIEHQGARVFGRYSHRSLIRHCGQSGLRALHT
jgi:hypothetical protein